MFGDGDEEGKILVIETRKELPAHLVVEKYLRFEVRHFTHIQKGGREREESNMKQLTFWYLCNPRVDKNMHTSSRSHSLMFGFKAKLTSPSSSSSTSPWPIASLACDSIGVGMGIG